jgi:hypothetical protein
MPSEMHQATTSPGSHQVSMRPVAPARRMAARSASVVSPWSLVRMARLASTGWAHFGWSDQDSPATHDSAVITHAVFLSGSPALPLISWNRASASSIVWVVGGSVMA